MAEEYDVVIVGAGPAGLSCAFALRRFGIRVTIFERRDRLGGVLSSTIPLYRFPDSAVKNDATWIRGKGDGIDLRLKAPVADVESLAKKYDAVFVAPGLAGEGPKLPGATLRGVSTGEEFLDSPQ